MYARFLCVFLSPLVFRDGSQPPVLSLSVNGFKKLSLVVEAQVNVVGKLRLVAVVLLAELKDDLFRVVALHVLHDVLGDQRSRYARLLAADALPLPFCVELYLGAVVEPYTILYPVVFIVRLCEHDVRVGEILVYKCLGRRRYRLVGTRRQ